MPQVVRRKSVDPRCIVGAVPDSPAPFFVVVQQPGASIGSWEERPRTECHRDDVLGDCHAGGRTSTGVQRESDGPVALVLCVCEPNAQRWSRGPGAVAR